MAEIVCPRCTHAMSERGCKVRCERCGLFYDCSDGMLPLEVSEGLEEEAS